MLDKELWNRWRASAKSTMNIPKIRKVWEETKGMHTNAAAIQILLVKDDNLTSTFSILTRVPF